MYRADDSHPFPLHNTQSLENSPSTLSCSIPDAHRIQDEIMFMFKRYP
jgi:hypothetical protein